MSVPAMSAPSITDRLEYAELSHEYWRVWQEHDKRPCGRTHDELARLEEQMHEIAFRVIGYGADPNGLEPNPL